MVWYEDQFITVSGSDLLWKSQPKLSGISFFMVIETLPLQVRTSFGPKESFGPDTKAGFIHLQAPLRVFRLSPES